MARGPSQTQRQIDTALKRLEPEVAAAFQAAIQAVIRQIDTGALIAALEAGNLGAAIRILDFPQAVLFPLEDAIRSAYMTGGQMIATAAPTALIAFDGRTPGAETWLRELSSTRIQGIYTETLQGVRTALVQGREQGMGSRSVARMITGTRRGTQRVGGIIGLTDQQTQSIMAARSKLASGDPRLMGEYLDLKLRNRTYDAKIRKAISEGRAITGKELDTILEAHKSKALAYRGKMIAENESFSALESGRREAVIQALENPDVEGASKRWQWNFSRDPREDHRALESAPARPFEEPFTMADGTQMQYAHDPAGGAKHTIGCGCLTVYRIRMRET